MPDYDTDNIDDDIDDELDDSIGDDWDDDKPMWQALVPMMAALIVGGVIGLIVGAQILGAGRASTNVDSQACLLLASELYRQGESIAVVQEHLRALGYDNAGPALLKLADEYEASGEIRKVRQSADLRQLGEALMNPTPREPTPAALAAASPSPTATSSPRPTEVPKSPTRTPPTPVKTPTAAIKTATPVPTARPASPTATPGVLATWTPTTAVPPSSPTPTPRPATITSSGGEGAVLRKEPTTGSDALANLSHGTPVEVLQVVNGEAIDETEPRWYKIRYGGLTGYVYFKLIKFGD